LLRPAARWVPEGEKERAEMGEVASLRVVSSVREPEEERL
jgi:hypothetical protein